MHELYCLSYISKLAENEFPSAVAEITKQSRKNNFLNEITGILIFDGSYFFQYIEGSQDKVLSLYESIKQDSRHHEVSKLFENGFIPPRRYAKWTMGFANIDDETLIQSFKNLGYLPLIDALKSIENQIDAEP